MIETPIAMAIAIAVIASLTVSGLIYVAKSVYWMLRCKKAEDRLQQEQSEHKLARRNMNDALYACHALRRTLRDHKASRKAMWRTLTDGMTKEQKDELNNKIQEGGFHNESEEEGAGS